MLQPPLDTPYTLSPTDEAAARLAAIVDSSDDAIVSKDLDGIVKSWNAGAERLFGYTAEEMIGQSIRRIIPDQHQTEEDEVLRRVRIGERVDHFETIRQRKDGRLVPISLTVSPVRDDHGTIIGASKIARDISVQKEAAEALRRSVALKDQFLGLISHELRTPISTIVANAQLLRRRAERLSEVDRHQALEDVASEGERLQQIIENLLILSRLDASREVQREAVDLASLAREVIAATGRRNGSNRPISFDVTDNLPRAAGDPALIKLVFDNLISNALKYSGPETMVEVVLSSDAENRPEAHVLDRGIGILQEDAPQLFEAFYRSESAKRKAPGMGLGLAVCHLVVDVMGGSIRAEARPGGGADFSFTLPTASTGPA